MGEGAGSRDEQRWLRLRGLLETADAYDVERTCITSRQSIWRLGGRCRSNGGPYPLRRRLLCVGRGTSSLAPPPDPQPRLNFFAHLALCAT